jgi:Protein of unknown function (DUF3829)
MTVGMSKKLWMVGLVLVVGSSAQLAEAKKAAPTKPAPPAAQTAAPVPAPAPKKKLGPPPSKATSAKVNQYIELMNAESNHMFGLREAWFKAIPAGAQPTCQENLQLELNLGPDGGKYDAYRKQLNAKPALAPDKAALAMVDAAQAAWLVGKRGGPRSKGPGKGINDEWCKKLKEVHPLMLDAFQKYAQGNQVVREYVDLFVDERDLREVDAVEKKYGKRYRYHFALMALEGKLMMRKLRAELEKSAPDVAAVHAAFAAYFTIPDAAKALYDAEPRPFKRDPVPPSFQLLLIEVTPKLKREAAELERVLSQKPDDKHAKQVDYQWGRLVDAYNEQVRDMNGATFDPQQK